MVAMVSFYVQYFWHLIAEKILIDGFSFSSMRTFITNWPEIVDFISLIMSSFFPNLANFKLWSVVPGCIFPQSPLCPEEGADSDL